MTRTRTKISNGNGQQGREPLIRLVSDLKVMSHSRFHDLLEGVVDPPPHPAVDVDALHSEPDRLLCEILVLRGGGHETDLEEVLFQKMPKCFFSDRGPLRRTSM